MASFLEQLEHAEMLLQTYRRPDLEEVLPLLDKVLQAAELGSIQYESVVRIQVQQQSVRIDTEWRTRCHAEGMVKSEESKVYAKREPSWRILRHEQSEFGEGETNVSTEWARLWDNRCIEHGMRESGYLGEDTGMQRALQAGGFRGLLVPAP